ncbi:MAG: hypothetical protein AB8G15_01225 [Saprospiraceae bacterium]
MSDFGALMSGTKKRTQTFSSDEIDAISQKLKGILITGDYSTSLGKKFNFYFTRGRSTNQIICLLSEYNYGEGEDDDNFEFVEENELDDVKAMTRALAKEFPTIDFVGSIENW